jgi:hypothetical protein
LVGYLWAYFFFTWRFLAGMVAVVFHHRKIRLIEGNAKCHLNKSTCKMDFAAGIHLSEAQNPIPLPPPSLHTVHVYRIQYTYSHRKGGRMWESGTREKIRGATVHRAGSKIPT